MRLPGLLAQLFAPALLLAGCAGHVLPMADQFVVPPGEDPAAAPRAMLFADANGSFYPSGWCARLFKPKTCAANPLNPPTRLKGDSLFNFADFTWAKGGQAFRALIETDEQRQLNDLAAFARGKKRLFILVHGFNSRVVETNEPFHAIEDRLDLQPGDGVIRFYWDGLTGSGLGALRIWFPAAGYSQVAGARGLRRVLDRIEGKPVYLIAHSRGASVILSALANPVYAKDFREKTDQLARGWRAPVINLLSPPPLKDNHNSFHLLLVAAAIGRIDFCDAREQDWLDGRRVDTPASRRDRIRTGGKDNLAEAWSGCVTLRRFGAQLKDIRYSVNISDPVLRKGVGFQYRFNPTTLGLEPEVGRALAQEGGYPMTAYFTDPPRAEHTFLEYVRDPTFYRMLCDAGILRPSLKREQMACPPTSPAP